MSHLVITGFTESYIFDKSTGGGQHQRYCLQNYIWKTGQASVFRCVGRKKSDTHRHILIRLKNYCDKDDLLSSTGTAPYVFENFTAEYNNGIEKVHTSFKNSECV